MLVGVISLSKLSFKAATNEVQHSIRAALAEITNQALVGVVAAEYLVNASDIEILSLRDGSLVVEFAAELPAGAKSPDGNPLTPEELADAGAAAIGKKLSNTEAVSRVLESSGLPDGTRLTVLEAPVPAEPNPIQTATPTRTAVPPPIATPHPPLPPGAGANDPWYSLDSPIMQAIIIGIATILLALLIALTWWLCTRKRKAKVNPSIMKVDEEDGTLRPGQAAAGEDDKVDSNSAVSQRQLVRSSDPPPLPPGPPPPWNQPNPAVKMRAQPPSFQPFVSPPRPPDHPVPYERLVLISSRVPGAMGIKDAVLSNCAVLVYDWKHFTLQELFSYIRRLLGGQKVSSIAIIAPAGKPGAVGLLEGYQTTPEKLSRKPELTQFWKSLGGQVVPVGSSGPASGRVDFLCCRVLEQPTAGAALLKTLAELTKLSFTASDDPRNGFPLSLPAEMAPDGSVYMADSSSLAMDLYFDSGRMITALQAVPRALSPPSVAVRQPPRQDPVPTPSAPQPQSLPGKEVNESQYLQLATALREEKKPGLEKYIDNGGLVSATQLKGILQV